MTDLEKIIATNAEYAKSYVDTENKSPNPRKRLAIGILPTPPCPIYRECS